MANIVADKFYFGKQQLCLAVVMKGLACRFDATTALFFNFLPIILYFLFASSIFVVANILYLMRDPTVAQWPTI